MMITAVSPLAVLQGIEKFATYRKEILQSRMLMVEGRLQREGAVVHVIVSKCVDLTKLLGSLKGVFHGGRNFK